MRRYRQPLSHRPLHSRSRFPCFRDRRVRRDARPRPRTAHYVYETDNPILASSLQLHIVAPDGAVMVHVRLDENAPAAQTLARLVA